jgi:integrase
MNDLLTRALIAAHAGTHYRIKGPGGWEIESDGPDDHRRAMEAISQMKTLPLPTSQPAQATYEPPSQLNHAQHANGRAATLVGRNEGDTMMGESMDEYLKYLPSSSKLGTKGQMESRASLSLFLQVVGNKPIQAITRADGETFVKLLQSWPAHSSKKPEFRDLDVKEVLAKAKELKAKVISPVTLHNRVSYVEGYFSWLRARNVIKFDPFESSIKPAAVPILTRYPFSDAELASIFEPAHRMWAKTPHAFWIPLLGFFTGARIRELAQLYIDDFEVILGIPVIHIAERFPGQQVKTPSSQRVVPLRPDLMNLGFGQYVDDIRAMGHKKLFPWMVWQKGDPGKDVSRSFNEAYLRRVCGITDPGKSFHCFRHLFATMANRSGLEDARIERLTGHKVGSTSAIRTNYIKAATLPERYEDIQSIPLPSLTLTPYTTGMFNAYFIAKRSQARRAKLAKQPNAAVSSPSVAP